MLDLIKASIKTGSSAFITILLRVLSVKILAVVFGPAGIGLFSLLRQARDTLVPLATIGSGTAIVQGVASQEQDEEKRQEYIGTVATLLGVNVLLFILAAAALAPWIGQLIFGELDSREMTNAVRWVTIPVILGAMAGFLTSLLNGYRAIGRLAVVQAAGMAALVLLTYPLARLANEAEMLGMTLLLVVTPAATVALAGYFLWKGGWLKVFRFRFRGWAAKHFFWMSIPTLAASFGMNGMLLAVRSMITRSGGLSAAGYFDMCWSFSLLYVNLVTSSFGTYYLPTLSGTHEREKVSLLIGQVVRLATVLLTPLIVGLVVLKPMIIRVFYSSEFLPAIELMQWMLIADYLKVTSWIFAYTVLAFANMKVFLWTELGFFGAFMGGAWISTRSGAGWQGIGASFLAMYIGYFAYMLYYVVRKHGYRPTLRGAAFWLGGLGIVAMASGLTWSQTA